MFRKTSFTLYVLLCLCCSFPVFCQEFETITRLIPHIDHPEKQVEFFALRPKLKLNLPVIIYVHGYHHDKMGARKAIENGSLAKIANEGYFTISVSQPGFGKSSGPPDFCGPISQRAVVTVMEYVKKEYKDFIDPNKIVLWGKSRGAIVVSNVATHQKNLAGLILDGGLYDMRAVTYDGIKRALEKEAGSSLERIKERSAIFAAENIKIPVLMLHGYMDDRSPIQQAIQFYEALMQTGSKATLVIFPTGHHVPGSDRRMLIRRYLRNLFEGEYETVPTAGQDAA